MTEHPGYTDLCVPLVFKNVKGKEGGENSRQVFVSGKKIQGFNLNFIVGVFEGLGDWAPGWGAHTHAFDELLVFFGYADDLNYLGADLEIAMGKEREPHFFSDPIIIAVPRDVPHNPLITKKVEKPFGHFHIALGDKYIKTQKRVEKEGETDGDAYSHYFKKMPVRVDPAGSDARQLVTMSGSDFEGMNVNISFGRFDKAGTYTNGGAGSHTHPYNEVMVFFSLEQTDIEHLGAEITVEIGPEGERHTFDTPMAIALPAGTPHFPLTCNRVDRSFAVMQIGLDAVYQKQDV